MERARLQGEQLHAGVGGRGQVLYQDVFVGHLELHFEEVGGLAQVVSCWDKSCQGWRHWCCVYISFGPSRSDGKCRFKKLLIFPLTCIFWSVEGTTNLVNRIRVQISASIEFPDFLRQRRSLRSDLVCTCNHSHKGIDRSLDGSSRRCFAVVQSLMLACYSWDRFPFFFWAEPGCAQGKGIETNPSRVQKQNREERGIEIFAPLPSPQTIETKLLH